MPVLQWLLHDCSRQFQTLQRSINTFDNSCWRRWSRFCPIPYHIFKLRSIPFVYNSIRFIASHHIPYWNLCIAIHLVTFWPNIIRELPSGFIAYFHISFYSDPFCSKPSWSDSSSLVMFHSKTFIFSSFPYQYDSLMPITFHSIFTWCNPFCYKPSWSDSSYPVMFHRKTSMLQSIQFL